MTGTKWIPRRAQSITLPSPCEQTVVALSLTGEGLECGEARPVCLGFNAADFCCGLESLTSREREMTRRASLLGRERRNRYTRVGGRRLVANLPVDVDGIVDLAAPADTVNALRQTSGESNSLAVC